MTQVASPWLAGRPTWTGRGPWVTRGCTAATASFAAFPARSFLTRTTCSSTPLTLTSRKCSSVSMSRSPSTDGCLGSLSNRGAETKDSDSSDSLVLLKENKPEPFAVLNSPPQRGPRVEQLAIEARTLQRSQIKKRRVFGFAPTLLPLPRHCRKRSLNRPGFRGGLT